MNPILLFPLRFIVGLRGFRRIALTIVLASAAAGGAAYAALDSAAWYWSRLAANRAWTQTSPVERASHLIGEIYDRALAAKFFSVEAGPDVLRIRTPPCEDRLSPLSRVAASGGEGEDASIVLRLVCDTIQGEAILDEIRQWNAASHFMAVRDDRGRREPCQDGRKPNAVYVEIGCKPSQWRARRLLYGEPTLGEAAAPGSPSPGDFAMVAAEARAGANDWLMIAPEAGSDEAGAQSFRLSTDVVLSREPWTIDLIGRPTALIVNGERRPLDPNGRADPMQFGPLLVSVELMCEEAAFDDGGCAVPPRPGVPHARAFTFKADKPGVAAAVAIEAAPVLNLPARLNDSNPARLTIRRTAHIEAVCTGARPSCDLQPWKSVAAVEALKRAPFKILARDGGESLTDEDGRITAEALKLGLAPIVGLGPQDFGSLSAALSLNGGEQERTVRLTIDKAMQKAAVEALNAKFPCPIAKSKKLPARSQDCDSDEQRAALVIMDADANPGEILAMASWPSIEPGMNMWDLLALEAGAATWSRIGGFASRATNLHNQPGSTFKLVTALAAAEAILARDEKVEDAMFVGDMAPNVMAERLGLKHLPKSAKDCEPQEPRLAPRPQGSAPPSYNVLPAPTNVPDKFFCVQNSGDDSPPLADSYLKPSVSRCPPRRGPDSQQIGVCEALIKSSNLWFAGVALLLDRDKVMVQEGGQLVESQERIDDLSIASMSRRLFPDVSFDLMRGRKGLRANRLFADPAVVAAALAPNVGASRQLRVALSGYGQSVTTTALAVSSMFASVGKGQVVRPRLAPRGAEEIPAPGEGEPILTAGTPSRQADFLRLIKAGLLGVAESPEGTAYTAFHGPPPKSEPSPLLNGRRFFSKTGTANVRDSDDERGKKPLHSSWLAGWLEGDPRRGVKRRIAFACWKSHSPLYGAQACGPIVRKALEALDDPRAGE